LPDSCDVGDILVDSVCLPAEAADLDDPDLVHVEEGASVPLIDNALSLPAVGQDPFLARGRLFDAASTGADTDYFTFEAQAYDWVDVALISYGRPGVSFRVRAPDGRTWLSPTRGVEQTGRQFVAPVDGTYRVEIFYDGDVAPVGAESDGWVYGLWLGRVEPPTPQVVDLSTEQTLSGDLIGLRDNVYRLTGLDADSNVRFRPMAAREPYGMQLQLWRADQFDGFVEFDHDEMRRSSGSDQEFLVVVDWSEMHQLPAPYGVRVSREGFLVQTTLQPGESYSVELDAQRLDELVLDMEGIVSRRITVDVDAPSGQTVFDDLTTRDSETRARLLESGRYTAIVTNKSTEPVDVALPIRLVAPNALGTLSGNPASVHIPRNPDFSRRFRFTASQTTWVRVAADCRGILRPGIEVYNSDGTRRPTSGSEVSCSDVTSGIVFSVESGSEYVVELTDVPTDPLELEVRQLPLQPVNLATGQASTYSGSLNCDPDGVQALSVTTTERVRLNGEIRGVSGAARFNVSIFDENVGDIDTETYLDAFQTPPVPAGDLLMLVTCESGAVNSTYELDMASEAATPIDLGQLAAGSSQTVNIATQTTPTFVEFSPVAGSNVLVRQSNANDREIRVAIFAADGTVIWPESRLGTANAAYFDTEIEQLMAGSEPVYLSVRSYGQYSVELTVESEAFVDLGDLSGASVTFDTPDIPYGTAAYARFELSEPTALALLLAPTGQARAELTVLDSEGEAVSPTFNDESGLVPESGWLDAGVYYLEVAAPSSSMVSYSVALRGFGRSTSRLADLYVEANSAPVQDDLQVSNCSTLNDLVVLVELESFVTYFPGGSLDLEVVAPDGTTVALSESTGADWSTMWAVFSETRTALDDISTLTGGTANGTWSLRASDTETEATHDIERWGLLLQCE
jgi:hypothetical protein